MIPPRIAAVLESLSLPLKQALRVASTLGIDGVQVDAVGDLSPDSLSQTGCKDFRHRLRSLNLELCALGCPLRHGLADLQNLDLRLQHVKKVLSLAFDLGPRLVVVFAGPIPAEEDARVRQVLRDSLTTLGRHAERVGSTLALATGLEPPATTAVFLEGLDCGGLGANVDPANFLARGFDPYAAVRTLHAYLAHVHARDTRAARPDRHAEEVPLGHGDVDWVEFLGALEEAGYRGWLTLRRGPCADPAGDLKAGAALLRRLGAGAGRG
jgi:sugar phosphate isomerase/epimerase